MDPNENLRMQQRVAARIIALIDHGGATDHANELADSANELAELVQSMDEWITKGGFLPNPWRGAQGDEESEDFLTPECGDAGES